MTDRAVLVPDRCLIMERRHARRFDLIGYRAVTLEAHLANGASGEHLCVRRSVRRVARGAAFRF